MRLILTALAMTLAASAAPAADRPAADRPPGVTPAIEAALETHILPGFDALAGTTGALADEAAKDCAPTSGPLRAAYNEAFDAWARVSHLRFGPTETGNRAFALAFWPDPRGKTPAALRRLIDEADPARLTAEGFAEVSIAARGFYALEFLLFDDEVAAQGDAAYRCALTRAVAADIARTARAIEEDWRGGYAETLRAPGASARYRDETEVAQELFKALTGGLEFTADARLGRPLGALLKPRPARAEARRSGRSLRNVTLALTSMEAMAAALATGRPDIRSALRQAFETPLDQAAKLDDPVFAGVATPAGRLKVEILQQSVKAARIAVLDLLGPALGVGEGFNALDGD